MLRLYQRMLDGRRQVIGFAKPGDLLLSPLERAQRVQRRCARPRLSLPFSAAGFHRPFCTAIPTFSPAFAIAIHEELMRARQQIALLGQQSAEPKMAQFLLALLESYARPDSETTLIPVRCRKPILPIFSG